MANAHLDTLLSYNTQMLAHVGHLDTSSLVHNAWLRTIEDGVHTADIYSAGVSSKKASTTEFTDAVIANLGNAPREIKTRRFGRVVVPDVPRLAVKPIKTMTGVDVFVDWDTKDRNPAVRFFVCFESHALCAAHGCEEPRLVRTTVINLFGMPPARTLRLYILPLTSSS